MELEKVKFSEVGAVIPEGYHACQCCGRKVKLEYQFCLGCYRKRMKVYDDCIGAGQPVEWARLKVDKAYPLNFG